MSSGRTSAIQRELKQTRPFSSLTQEAFLGILRTADVLRRRLGQHLTPYDLTPQQYNVLRILRGAGADGLPTLEIAERMIEEAPGITRLLDRIEAKGLVVRERSRKDRRQVFCWIAEPGLEVLARLDPSVQELDAQGLGNLSEAELTHLIGLLDRVRSSG